MAQKRYISVLSSDNTTNQKVKMLNPENEFTGKLISANPSGGQAKDVRDLFISEVKVDGTTITPRTENNVRVVDIPVGESNKIEKIKVNGQEQAIANKTVDIKAVTSVSLAGSLGGEIVAVPDANGKAKLQLEELEFQELNTDVLYLHGVDITTLIPNLGRIAAGDVPNADKLDLNESYSLEDIAWKYNQLADKFNHLLLVLKKASQQSNS